jgi:hypothetical protein
MDRAQSVDHSVVDDEQGSGGDHKGDENKRL